MKHSSLLLTPILLLATALSAFAQEKNLTTRKENDGTLKVTVSGGIDLDWVWRDENANFPRGDYAGGGGDPTEESGTFETSFNLALDVDLTDKVSANMTLGNYRAQTGSGVGGNLGNNAETTDVFVTDLYLLFAEAFSPKFSVKVGTQNHAFNVAGRGGALFFDPRNSESFANNTFNGSTIGGSEGAVADVGGQDTLQPTGVTGTYVDGNLELNVILWPATIEGGRSAADQSNLGADFWYKLDDKSRIGGILMITSFATANPLVLGGSTTTGAVVDTQVITLGGGVNLGMIPNLKLYGEIYIQFGDAGVLDIDPGPAVNAETMDAGGRAFRAGMEYSLGGDLALWLGGNLTYISGDGNEDDEIENFLSYENVNELLIIEDHWFGFDIDTNLLMLKGMAGFTVKMAGKDLHLTGILGIVSAPEDIRTGAPPGDEDAYGVELDVRASLAWSKSIAINAQMGILFGSDILEAAEDAAGVNDPDDQAFIFTLGPDVKF